MTFYGDFGVQKRAGIAHFFLRRHYPDQVGGYDLSRCGTPKVRSKVGDNDNIAEIFE